MNTAYTIFAAIVAFLLIILLIKIIKTPLKFVLKLLINMVCGLVLLFIFNMVGEALFEFTLGINTVTALVAGLLGIPGVILLVLISIYI